MWKLEFYDVHCRTVVVNPDGSTSTIRYHEPRGIITLPFDLSQLSDAERKARMDKRKPKRQVKIEVEVDDKFNANKYLKYMKKKWDMIMNKQEFNLEKYQMDFKWSKTRGKKLV